MRLEQFNPPVSGDFGSVGSLWTDLMPWGIAAGTVAVLAFAAWKSRRRKVDA